MEHVEQERSILIIGASGRLGRAVILAISHCPNKPQIHAFCRDVGLFQSEADVSSACTSVLGGDGRSSTDLDNALRESGANLVIVAIGNGKDRSNANIRHANAEALSQVLIANEEFGHVRVCVISCAGAGSSSSIRMGMGVGSVLRRRHRDLLEDHTRQERTFLLHIKHRVGFIRPTIFLKDRTPTHQLQTFDDDGHPQSLTTFRSDLADWIAEAVCSSDDPFLFQGRSINITCVRRIRL